MGVLSQEVCDYIANDLEQYLTVHQMCIIIEGCSEKKYKKAVEKVEETIKKLRKGKTKKCVDPEMAERLGPTLEYEARHQS